jgi:hypothetical protein
MRVELGELRFDEGGGALLIKRAGRAGRFRFRAPPGHGTTSTFTLPPRRPHTTMARRGRCAGAHYSGLDRRRTVVGR